MTRASRQAGTLCQMSSRRARREACCRRRLQARADARIEILESQRHLKFVEHASIVDPA